MQKQPMVYNYRLMGYEWIFANTACPLPGTRVLAVKVYQKETKLNLKTSKSVKN